MEPKPPTGPATSTVRSGIDYDWVFKVLMIGEPMCGKTSLTSRYCKNEFPKDYLLTIGVDFSTKQVSLYEGRIEKTVQMQVWDIGGQKRFEEIRPPFYRGAAACGVVVDMTRKETLDVAVDWLDNLYQTVTPVIPTVLFLNKADLKKERQVEKKDVKNMLKQIYDTYDGYRKLPVAWFETSAKTGLKVEDAFAHMAQMAMQRAGPY